MNSLSIAIINIILHQAQEWWTINCYNPRFTKRNKWPHSWKDYLLLWTWAPSYLLKFVTKVLCALNLCYRCLLWEDLPALYWLAYALRFLLRAPGGACESTARSPLVWLIGVCSPYLHFVTYGWPESFLQHFWTSESYNSSWAVCMCISTPVLCQNIFMYIFYVRTPPTSLSV